MRKEFDIAPANEPAGYISSLKENVNTSRCQLEIIKTGEQHFTGFYFNTQENNTPYASFAALLRR